ncbi:MAG: GNAT family N-acetyltransferase [Mycobacterium sp.]|uniref:GNAT family N-acetyltransferase n=1 Tax=Mycobacterium sp. TaxID=1785 RepID=UPI003899DA5E
MAFGPHSFAFFAEEEGRLGGYVVGFYDEPHFMWSTGRVGHIDSFYVLPELRGRGVGRLLMEAADAEMRQAGATTVALEMVAKNDVARRFYEREGFTTMQLTFETLQAAYSQPTFRNPLWDHKIRKRLRRPISRRSISSSATVLHSTGRLNGSSQQAEMFRLGPGDCGESGCRGREKVRHD